MSKSRSYTHESVNRVYESVFYNNLSRPTLLAATILIHYFINIHLTQTL